MEIKASDVKNLREKTGAGMMECKNALVASEGDFAAAEKFLKEKGLAAVEKRADRATNEGKIFIKIKDNTAVLVELASETDFVARNPDFIALGGQIADKVLEKGYSEINDELSSMVTDLATKIRENMSLKRIRVVKADANEYMSQYIHGDGNIGVVVKVGADKPEALSQDCVKDFAFSLALHIAAFNPMALDRSKIDPSFIKEQEEIFRKQMEQDEKMKGKPAGVIDNILQGKINKYLSDICLMDQGYVKDEKLTVAKVTEDIGKQVGAKLSINDYVYFKVGQ
ncbi:translation elongation factor Ts [Breznakiella homolactica]|uniref:Elongation factor Ts n=1 Tax=Breznakiella homolactica TaxID=2798577 RepID=A0A7T8BAD1_9SPIR|nr:translation elongation factor Ts [Breznakiella homolactica]QQO08088.1 translation elongation factor Ts [Breznakiella homolactica]